MAGLTLSSALWLSAMAANPTGIAIAKEFGVNISYGLWVAAAIVPITVLFILIPYLLYKIYPPEIKHTPNAPLIADEALQHMGKVSKNEWIMLATFVVMIFLWIFSSQWHINKTAVAFLGLAILMITNIFTLDDMKNEGNALETLIWFGILYTLSVYLNKFGFMGWLGDHIAEGISGFSPFIIYFILVIGYVLIHYLFVSQTAHMLALFSIFLEVGIHGGVNPELLTLMLLFATNFNAIITPQGSSANVLYVGSGYVEPGEIYKIGGIVTLVNSIVFLTIGTVWILQIT